MRLKLRKFNILKSTNDTAHQLIKKNLYKPTMVTSNIQTKGRGTMGKKWISKKGNIFFSIFFEINPKKINFKHYATLNAFLVKKIISKYINKKIKIKWPNDLLIEKKKICGILQEVISFKKKNFLIVGVGINSYFSPYISGCKTSCLNDHSKKNLDNNKILKDIKKNYEKFIDETKKQQLSYLLKTYKNN